jgi:hypothetical protein
VFIGIVPIPPPKIGFNILKGQKLNESTIGELMNERPKYIVGKKKSAESSLKA